MCICINVRTACYVDWSFNMDINSYFSIPDHVNVRVNSYFQYSPQTTCENYQLSP